MRFLKDINLPIILSSLLLLSIGIIVLLSSSLTLASQQLFATALGFIIFLLLSHSDYRALTHIIYPTYLITLLLLIVVFVVGIETRGSVRWIPLGFFNIQPSELAKPVLILLLADFWSKHLPNWKNISLSVGIILPALFLIFKQPDLGTTLTITAIFLGMLLITRISFKKVVLLGFLFTITMPLIWLNLQDYQKQRVFNFLSPNSDPLGTGYNIIQSTIAVGSGQVFGRGLGSGTQSRLQFLPEFRTDFIFAAISEELGLVGALVILSLYGYLIFYLLKVSKETGNSFGYLIIYGVVTMILFQVFVNIGMNVGILPITGITLPLVSYGGSSLLATLICLGLSASVANMSRKLT
ncbi:MAG: rod shape-determining protein RodA [Candidatus Daviesbacteria bacterium]|nr:MAG: rod shape-determining protein RodA [Candidatus Daviesbacteria bacterium]